MKRKTDRQTDTIRVKAYVLGKGKNVKKKTEKKEGRIKFKIKEKESK